ncbi:MAG: hypothetical protein EBR13_00675 [Rhodobacteraceae bacterium]|nr:hypothetical protein [Paracoccaceae bacterium]
MSDQPSLFSDFWPRMITGLLMAVTGLYAVWLGGPIYVAMIFLIAGILIWELAVMLGASLMCSAGLCHPPMRCLFCFCLPFLALFCCKSGARNICPSRC